MDTGPEHRPGHQVTPVSPSDVARVVGRALAERTGRIRLTSGQRLAIVHAPVRPGAARA
jgi:hypothetical protein